MFARMRFLRNFYLSLVSLNKMEFSDGLRYLTAARDQVKNMAATTSLGVPEPESENEQLTGFDKRANQRLLPPTFPRYTAIKSRSEAIEYLKELIERLILGIGVAQRSTFQSALVINTTERVYIFRNLNVIFIPGVLYRVQLAVALRFVEVCGPGPVPAVAEHDLNDQRGRDLRSIKNSGVCSIRNFNASRTAQRCVQNIYCSSVFNTENSSITGQAGEMSD